MTDPGTRTMRTLDENGTTAPPIIPIPTEIEHTKMIMKRNVKTATQNPTTILTPTTAQKNTKTMKTMKVPQHPTNVSILH